MSQDAKIILDLLTEEMYKMSEKNRVKKIKKTKTIYFKKGEMLEERVIDQDLSSIYPFESSETQFSFLGSLI